MPTPVLPDEDALYKALSTHDARFDGRFFTGVTSTGVYCRPICRVRTPQRANCRFFELAAQAEQAGFRPCLRCRPELAPADRHWSTEDSGDILIRQATAWLDSPQHQVVDDGGSTLMGRLSDRLGVSDRHLRRLFEQRLGVSPLQYLATRRLLTAKQLLTDTTLPVTDVALAAGFSSVRRFNAAFVSSYSLTPTALRRSGSTATGPARVRLAWRPPYQADALLTFLAQRAIPGVEQVDTALRTMRRTLRVSVRGQAHTGWLEARLLPERQQLWLSVSDSLTPALATVIALTRQAFDLDADPLAIDAALGTDFPGTEGMRVPGAYDAFELAVRAVLGQQVTVSAARTLAARLATRLGDAIDTGDDRLARLFPTAQAIAGATPSVLGELGIVRQRQAALQALARGVLDGTLVLDGASDPDEQIRRLVDLPGIGPWTAQYIAMRALRWPDAWPVGDVAVHQALGLGGWGAAAARREAERRAGAWRPWRSYAVIRAWARLNPTPSGDTP